MASHRRGRLAVLLALIGTILTGVPPGTSLAQSQLPGAIRGTVYDADFQVPMAQVRVWISETRMTTLSSEDGDFLFERVPPGRYTLTFTKDGYERRVKFDVVVTPGQMNDLRIELASEVVEMEELVVTGADLLADSEIGQLEIRAAAVSVQDAISSELIRKAGVSDVAGALKLVVGASVVEGKYATVRGLSDRYTGTTVNGVRIPSTDPRKRAVQVDVFPTGTVENVTVTKTFTPDLQGDFTGGGVDIQTKSVPEGKILSVKLSSGYNSLATRNQDYLSYPGGGVPTLGFAGRERDLPAEARDPLPPRPQASPRPTEESIEAAQAWDRFSNAFAPAMGVDTTTPGFDQGLSIVAGNRYPLGQDDTLGVIGALTYSHDYDYFDGGLNNSGLVGVANEPIALTVRSDRKGTEELLLGGLLNVVWQPNESSEYSLKVVANQSARDEARFQVKELGGSLVEQNQSLHYLERTVGSLQLHGNSPLGRPFGGSFSELTVNWVAAYNVTRQDEPDRRFFRNFYDEDLLSAEMPSNSTEAQNTRRNFREIEEDGHVGAVDFELPFTQWTHTAGKLKAGLFLERSDRTFQERTFVYSWTTRQCCVFTSDEVKLNRSYVRYQGDEPGDLWTDVFTDPERIGMASNVDSDRVADNQLLWVLAPLGTDVDYSGEQAIEALYLMADLPLSARLRLIGGARYERTDLSVSPSRPDGQVEIIRFDPDNLQRYIDVVPQEEAKALIEDSDILPSVGLVFEWTPGMNLRASWSKTIARPTIRELAPVATSEYLDGDEVVGNPDLVLTDVTNYDLRWEWFRRPGEVLAVSLFYKDLRNPIEYLSFGASNRFFIQPVNYERGTARGVEFEARTSLDVVHRWLETVSVGLNYTAIDSEVEVPALEQQSLASFGLDQTTRRLQGQPDSVLNANVTWDYPRTGSSVALFYNRVGEVLLTGAAVGDSAVPDVLETTFDSLDVRFSQSFPRVKKVDFSVSLKGSNLLQSEKGSVFRTPYGEEEIKLLHDTATKIGLSLNWKW
jgi:outer membrane receptor protein involved in Fe transport